MDRRKWPSRPAATLKELVEPTAATLKELVELTAATLKEPVELTAVPLLEVEEPRLTAAGAMQNVTR